MFRGEDGHRSPFEATNGGIKDWSQLRGNRVDYISILKYHNIAMSRKKIEEDTRQIYASVREDLYLAAKAQATELRMSLREFVEHALELALTRPSEAAPSIPSVWDDEYIGMQTRQPIGSPVELTREEAETVVKSGFDRSQKSG